MTKPILAHKDTVHEMSLDIFPSCTARQRAACSYGCTVCVCSDSYVFAFGRSAAGFVDAASSEYLLGAFESTCQDQQNGHGTKQVIV